MHETPADLQRLQALLDRSHAAAGGHLRSIFRPERRITAAELCALLPGVRVLSLATVTKACEPLVAPVDGLLFRGTFYFGSSHDSVRFRHLRMRPQVSAAHVRGEELAVLIHGTAHEIDLSAAGHAPVRAHLLEVYGPAWDDWGAPSAYARIEPRRLLAMRTTATG